MPGARRYELDNLRGGMIVIVMVSHVGYFFNACGVPGSVGAFREVQVQDVFQMFFYPWAMVLLFVLAGISARWSLQKRSARAFLRERTQRLLIPSTLGVVLAQWPTGYLHLRAAGVLGALSGARRYWMILRYSVGPLWFCQLLWLYSILLLPLRLCGAEERLHALCARFPAALLPLLSLPLWLASHFLNAPTLVYYRVGIYLCAFLLGYFLLSQERLQEAAEQLRGVYLAAALLCGAFFTLQSFDQNYSDPARLAALLPNLYAWSATLALLGLARARWSRETRFTVWMNRCGFGLYVLHYPITLAVCYHLRRCAALPPPLIYALSLAATLLLTPLVWQLLRRIPDDRWCVLGIDKKKIREP